MASAAAPSVASTKETTNYARLCRLLVDVGSQALRDTFDRIHPPVGLHSVLAPGTPAHSTLQLLRKKRILNDIQLRKLYPTIPTSVSSASFDITLLMVLLRNICHLTPPLVSGWDKLPSAADTSTEANIARVKFYRNTVYGHASQASVDDAAFNILWQHISQPLVALGGASYSAAINKLKNECMDPDTEEHYRELLKEWKRDEHSIKEKLEEMEVFNKKLLKQVKEEKGNITDKLGQVEENLKLTVEQMGHDVKNAVSEKLDSLRVSSQNEEKLKKALEQMGHQVKKVSEKLDSLRQSSQDEDTSRNELQQLKSEIANISEKLDTLMVKRETEDEESNRDNLEQMRKEMKMEMADIKVKLDTLMNRLPLEEKKLRMEDGFDPDEIIDRIRHLYKVREGWLAPFPWCEDFYFHLDSIFTRLKVVSRKKTRGTATDNIVNMAGIFKPHEECRQPRTVLIEGKPGMGKTTYCEKMVYDWATGKQEAEDCCPRFQTVLLLKCRDVKSNLWEAIDDQLLPLDINEDVRVRFFNFICQNQSSLLLVLDGLDEVPTSKLPVLAEIIQGRRELPKCRVVATARHETGTELRKHCDTLLQIEGFTKDDAKEFIFKYFKDMKYLAKKLLSKLESDKDLSDMAANPLNTALLCLICEEFKGIFPESRSQLYEEMIQCILRRYRRKKELPETNEDLVEVYEIQLKHLGQVALTGLLEDNLGFEESELKNHADKLPGFGFLSLQTGGSKRRPARHYSFLHKSFQECFAAFYLCCQLLKKEISVGMLAADRRYFKELKEVLSFTCGMVAARCRETAEALIKSITVQVNDEECLCTLLEFISECKEDDSNFHLEMARVSGSFLKLPILDFSRSKPDVVLLFEALKVNSSLTTLHLGGNGIGDQGATGLAEALKVNSSLTALHLGDNGIGDQGATGLAEALKVNSTLTELQLHRNKIGDQGATGLAEALKVNSTLTELQLHRNEIGDQGATGLAEAFKVNSTLTELDLHKNVIGGQGATNLAEAIKVNSYLTKLCLDGNVIGKQGATVLAEALEVNSTLTVLKLKNSYIGVDQGATGLSEALSNSFLKEYEGFGCFPLRIFDGKLAEALKINSSLTKLYLNGNGIGDEGATGLAKALAEEHSTLTELGLNDNGIGDQGTADLAEALKGNSTLTVLKLRDGDIGDQGATCLAEALKVNSTLTKLELKRNRIGDQGATNLAEALKVNSSLTKICLGNNATGYQGATGFGEALKVNSTLTKLHLGKNRIGAQGATGLAEALKVNSTLTQLDLNGNVLDDQDATGLAEALKVNSTLTDLDLHVNCIGDQGATNLAEALKLNSSLTKLNLVSNEIGDQGATGLAEACKVNSTLTELDLYGNPIGGQPRCY